MLVSAACLSVWQTDMAGKNSFRGKSNSRQLILEKSVAPCLGAIEKSRILVEEQAVSWAFNRTGSCWSSSEAAPLPRGHMTGHRGPRSTWAPRYRPHPPHPAAAHSGTSAAERGSFI